MVQCMTQREYGVLLVEDNAMNQQVATELLESAGAIVTIANHGGEAVKILTAGDKAPAFDVVFMDSADAGDGWVYRYQTTAERYAVAEVSDYCDDGARPC